MGLERNTEHERSPIRMAPAESNLIALSAGAKEIRREAQQVINILEGIKDGTFPDDGARRTMIQANLDAISLTIRALQKRFNQL